MQKIPWTVIPSNESVLMEVNRNAALLNNIRAQKAQFIGHLMRRHSLEHLATTAKIEGKRAR